MKKISVVCCLFMGSLIFSTAEAKGNEESLDQTVAVVNDDVITSSELNRSLTAVKMQIAHENTPQPSEAALKKQVLDKLVNKKLQLQVAKQSGIGVTEDDLNKTVAHIAEQNHMSVSELYQRLTTEGMSATEYRNEMRDQLTLNKLQQQEVVSHIIVSPQEVDRFMKSHPWQSNNKGPKEYRLDDILIPISDTPSPKEIQAAEVRANMVFTKLKQGQDFQSVARVESSEAHALEGGDLGWRQLAEIPAAFADKVASMQPKQLAGPIQTPNGFHIIRLAEVRSGGAAQAAPTHKEVENLLLQRKFEEAVQNWVSKLRSQAYISLNSEKQSANEIA